MMKLRARTVVALLTALTACGGHVVIVERRSDDGGGGQSSTSSNGGANACSTSSDCPPPPNACSLTTCIGGACRTTNVEEGTRVMKDRPADCRVVVCDGVGKLTQSIDPSNVPTPESACFVGFCAMSGAPSFAPTDKGVACTSSSGGTRCDGAGNCVRCLDASDCPSGEGCTRMKTCAPATCLDGLKDGVETDVDCGGPSCPGCEAGQMCQMGSDCTSDICDSTSHTCAGARCDDGQKNGDETDVDCGGSCSPCGLARACLANQDCASGACDTSHLCVADRCSDGHQDGDETDVDCGGSCLPCGVQSSCDVDQDCTSDDCDAARFICLPDACNDGQKDGAETDIDCGGGVCAGCDDGMACVIDADCAAHVCDPMTLRCIGNHCADHRQDDDESDVDCGGTVCRACAPGKKCKSGIDCDTGCSATLPHVCL
jgi:hypothetical protein